MRRGRGDAPSIANQWAARGMTPRRTDQQEEETR